MNRYEPTCPRLAFGLAAVIMSAITIGVLVALPSKMEPESQELAMLTAASSLAAIPCAAISLKCEHLVVGPGTASDSVQALGGGPKCKYQG